MLRRVFQLTKKGRQLTYTVEIGIIEPDNRRIAPECGVQMSNNQNNNYGQYNQNRQMNSYRGGSRQPQYAPRQTDNRGGQSNAGLNIIVLLCALVAVIAVFYISCSMCGSCAKEPTPPVTEQQQQSVPEPATVRVTFPEGFNVMQYGARLEENNVCSASDFYETMNTVDFSESYDFLPEFSELEGRDYYLEGYLFPDTYDFYVGESPKSVIRRFLNNFDAKIGEELRQAALLTGEFYRTETDLDDIIIMASIVEREISVPSEMPGVAAVFWNRMKYPGGTVDGSATGGFFQSDATKFYPYVMDTAPGGFVSDYNTFNVKGLPKGPICCPSYDAIVGSIYPDHDNGSFFFYTDINKKVYYAVTLKEHQANWKYCVDNGLNPW